MIWEISCRQFWKNQLTIKRAICVVRCLYLESLLFHQIGLFNGAKQTLKNWIQNARCIGTDLFFKCVKKIVLQLSILRKTVNFSGLFNQFLYIFCLLLCHSDAFLDEDRVHWLTSCLHHVTNFELTTIIWGYLRNGLLSKI